MGKSSQPTAISEMVEEARVRQRAEEEARHVMGAVPIILDATVVSVVICIAAVVLVAVLR